MGKLGRVVIALRGRGRPGEIMVRIRGGSETFIAHSDEDLPVGSSVIVISRRADRGVEVTAFSD